MFDNILITSALEGPELIRIKVTCNLWRITRDTAQTAFRNSMSDMTSLEKDLVMDFLPGPRSSVIPIIRRHPFILESFSHPLPVPDRYKARFKPVGYHKNVFYSGISESVPIHESAFYILRERIHLALAFEEPRTLFSVAYTDPKCLDISAHRNIKTIMDRNSHAASWVFIAENETKSLQFPCARTSGSCVAVYEIDLLGSQINGHQQLIFRTEREKCEVLDASSRQVLHTIQWCQVS